MKKKTVSIIYLSISIIASSVVLSGCNSDQQELERPEKMYYDQAQRRMKGGNYLIIIHSFFYDISSRLNIVFPDVFSCHVTALSVFFIVVCSFSVVCS